MAHPYAHALNSVKRYGGTVEAFQPLHDWFDATKRCYADFRHRALRHHAEGIFLAEEVFGTTIDNGAGKRVPVRQIGEDHVKEDLGWIPSAQDWLQNIAPKAWMMRSGSKQAAEPVTP